MQNRREFITCLFWKLWTDADFESDFQSAWFAEYQLFQEHRENEIPDIIIDLIQMWTFSWCFESEYAR